MGKKKNILKYLHCLTKTLSSSFYCPPPLLLSSLQPPWNAPQGIQEEEPHTPETERNRFRRNLSQLAATDALCCKRGESTEGKAGSSTATRLVAMESYMKGIRGDTPCVLDMDPTHTVGGGVEDFYGEDRATEDQLVTPWTVSVARSRFFQYSFSFVCIFKSCLAFGY